MLALMIAQKNKKIEKIQNYEAANKQKQTEKIFNMKNSIDQTPKSFSVTKEDDYEHPLKSKSQSQ